MITKSLARELGYGQELHYGPCTRKIGPRGGVTETIERWRVSGRCKTWKTRPDEFEVPIKHGLRTSTYLTHRNADQFHLEADCPLHQERAQLEIKGGLGTQRSAQKRRQAREHHWRKTGVSESTIRWMKENHML